MNHLFEILQHSAHTHGRRVFLKFHKQRQTYAQVLQRSEQIALRLRDQGVQPGDSVALLLENHPDYVAAIFAIARLDAVLIPINTFLKLEEVQYILRDSGARLLIAGERFSRIATNARKDSIQILYAGSEAEHREDHLDQLTTESQGLDEFESRPEQRTQMAMIIYTSGTTGTPKGAMLSHGNLLSNIQAVCDELPTGPTKKFLVFLPMFHSFTLTVNLLIPAFMGASLRIFQGVKPFNPIIKSLVLERIDYFISIPLVYNTLVKARIPWYLKMIWGKRIYVSGGGPLPGDTLEKFSKRFRGNLIEGYGLSEASPVVSLNPLNAERPGSIGKPLPNLQVKIVDEDLVEVPVGSEGELIVRGPNVMKGYYKRPDDTEQTLINGWLRTGDVARCDEDGYLYIVDRIKDMIIVKGINVYPREIEELLYKHQLVEHAAVIGQADEHSGEVPIGYIVLAEGQERDNAEQTLKKYLRQHLANYKIPRHIHVIDELPLNATGKVLKRKLREQVRAAQQARANVTTTVEADDPEASKTRGASPRAKDAPVSATPAAADKPDAVQASETTAELDDAASPAVAVPLSDIAARATDMEPATRPEDEPPRDRATRTSQGSQGEGI